MNSKDKETFDHWVSIRNDPDMPVDVVELYVSMLFPPPEGCLTFDTLDLLTTMAKKNVHRYTHEPSDE